MKTVFEIFMYPISPQVHTLPGSEVQVTGTVKIQIPLFPASMCVCRTSTSAERLQSLAKNSQNTSICAQEQSQATPLWGPQSLSSSHPFSAFQKLRSRTSGNWMRKQTEIADATVYSNLPYPTYYQDPWFLVCPSWLLFPSG